MAGVALTWQLGGRHASDEVDVDDDMDDGGDARVPMVTNDCGHNGECEGAHCVAQATTISTVHARRPKMDGGEVEAA